MPGAKRHTVQCMSHSSFPSDAVEGIILSVHKPLLCPECFLPLPDVQKSESLSHRVYSPVSSYMSQAQVEF